MAWHGIQHPYKEQTSFDVLIESHLKVKDVFMEPCNIDETFLNKLCKQSVPFVKAYVSSTENNHAVFFFISAFRYMENLKFSKNPFYL